MLTSFCRAGAPQVQVHSANSWFSSKSAKKVLDLRGGVSGFSCTFIMFIFRANIIFLLL